MVISIIKKFLNIWRDVYRLKKEKGSLLCHPLHDVKASLKKNESRIVRDVASRFETSSDGFLYDLFLLRSFNYNSFNIDKFSSKI